MKTGRFVSALVAILLSGVAADSAYAARKGAGAARSNGHPVSFTITSAQCASVPAGADVQGTGVQIDIAKTLVTAGVTREIGRMSGPAVASEVFRAGANHLRQIDDLGCDQR